MMIKNNFSITEKEEYKMGEKEVLKKDIYKIFETTEIFYKQEIEPLFEWINNCKEFGHWDYFKYHNYEIYPRNRDIVTENEVLKILKTEEEIKNRFNELEIERILDIITSKLDIIYEIPNIIKDLKTIKGE